MTTTRTVRHLDVTTRLDGSTLRIPVIELSGASDGPTLVVVSALHGSEWMSVLMVREMLAELAEVDLRGRIIAIPVANPPALENESRMIPDRSDEPDLNRVWPGSGTWLSQQMAAAIGAELDGADCVIDIHTGGWGHSIDSNAYPGDISDTTVRQVSAECAVAFGQPLIRGLNVMTGFPGPRSIEGYASAMRGIPAIAPNLGGLGFSSGIEAGWIRDGVQGIRNVAIHLGMIGGDPQLPERYFHFTSRGHRVTPTVGGLVDPVIDPSRLRHEVAAGTVLGRVLSPYTFDVLEELTAPCDGVLFSVARTHMARPGDFAYFVADGAHPDSRWVSGQGTVSEIAARLLDV